MKKEKIYLMVFIALFCILNLKNQAQTCGGYFFIDIVFENECDSKNSETVRRENILKQIESIDLTHEEDLKKMLNDSLFRSKNFKTQFEENIKNPARIIADKVFKGEILAYSDTGFERILPPEEIQKILWALSVKDSAGLAFLKNSDYSFRSLRMRQYWIFNKESLSFEIKTDAIALTEKHTTFHSSNRSKKKIVNEFYEELFWIKIKHP